MTIKQLRETIMDDTVVLGPAAEAGRLRIGIINPGWGSSGYYPRRVLENALDAGLWGEGLHLYIDHPSESERHERPERSLRDIAAIATSPATWDDEFGGPVIEAKPIGAYRDLLSDQDFLAAIGVSIRATGTLTEGEAEGRRGVIITELTECQSVDFVTRAGRGGRVLSLLESARATLAEAATDDMRDQLQRSVQTTHGGPGRYAWLRDFDPARSVAWIATSTEDGAEELLEQPYLDQGGTLTLTGEAVPVRAVTTYQPLTAAQPVDESRTPQHDPPVTPAGTTTQSPKEDAMPQIEEARLRQLEEESGRAKTLAAELEEARTQLAEAHTAIRENRARAVINAVEADQRVTFTSLEQRGLTAQLPVTESGDLDEEKLREQVREAAAEKASAAGAGTVRGHGYAPDAQPISWDDIPRLGQEA